MTDVEQTRESGPDPATALEHELAASVATRQDPPLRQAVVFAWFVPPGLESLGEYYLALLAQCHADSRLFIGMNHDSDPAWETRFRASGLDVEVRWARPELGDYWDTTGFITALEGFHDSEEAFDLVWFGHTKGASGATHTDYDQHRTEVQRNFWARRSEIETIFANPEIGLFARRLTPWWEGICGNELLALQRVYREECSPLGASAVDTFYVLRAAIVRRFCDVADDDFWTDPGHFGANRWFFEMAFPSIASMQGFQPYVDHNVGGADDPRRDVWLRHDPRQNHRLVEAWLATARPEAPDEVLRVLLERTALGSVGFGEPQAPDAFPGSAVTAASTASPVKVLPSSVNRGMRILPETSWRPVLQRSIDAFYESALDEGIAACLTLLNEPALPAHIRDLTYRNQVFYARPLADLVPGARWQALEAPPGDAGALRDPSPLIAGERLIVVMRDEAGVSASAPLTLALADADLPAMEVVTFPAQSRAGFTFCEARPFAWQGEMYVAAIRREGEDEQTARAVVLKLRDGEWVEVATLGPRAGHFRQGWSPVVTPDGPRFVSWWEPTEVFQFDAAATAMEREALRLAPHLAERFRGGSPGIAVPGGYLWLVNETVSTEGGPAETLSRFVRTDAAFQIAAVSPHFFLTSRGHDVATGLARHGEQVIAGFASAGSGPVVATMDIEPVLAVLIPVAAPGRS